MDDRVRPLHEPQYPWTISRRRRAASWGVQQERGQPVPQAAEAMRNAAFTKHTYRHTTLGFLKDILDMPNQYDYSLRFFDRFYRRRTVSCWWWRREKERCRPGEEVLRRLEARHVRAAIPVEPGQKEEQRVDLEWPWRRSRTCRRLPRPGLLADGSRPAGARPGVAALFSESAPLYQKLGRRQVVDVLGAAPDHPRSLSFSPG